MSLAVALALGLGAATAHPGFGFDRVDLLSEDPGTFLHYDAPMARHNVQAAGLRFVEQVKVSLHLPVDRLYLGLSLQSQSLTYEQPLLPEQGLFASAGLQTRLLLPRGVTAGLAWRSGRFRVGVSLSAFSQTSWARPNWQQWSLLPTLGLGVGARHEGAPRELAPAPIEAGDAAATGSPAPESPAPAEPGGDGAAADPESTEGP